MGTNHVQVLLLNETAAKSLEIGGEFCSGVENAEAMLSALKENKVS